MHQRLIVLIWAAARYQMQDTEERRLRRTSSTPQGEAIEGNAADDALLASRLAFSPLTP